MVRVATAGVPAASTSSTSVSSSGPQLLTAATPTTVTGAPRVVTLSAASLRSPGGVTFATSTRLPGMKIVNPHFIHLVEFDCAIRRWIKSSLAPDKNTATKEFCDRRCHCHSTGGGCCNKQTLCHCRAKRRHCGRWQLKHAQSSCCHTWKSKS